MLMRLFSDGHPVLRQDSVLDISIIGAGVSGLSTGIRLLEAGHDVTIFTECISPVSYTHLTLPTR